MPELLKLFWCYICVCAGTLIKFTCRNVEILTAGIAATHSHKQVGEALLLCECHLTRELLKISSLVFKRQMEHCTKKERISTEQRWRGKEQAQERGGKRQIKHFEGGEKVQGC